MLPRRYVLVIAEKPKAAAKIAAALNIRGKGRIYGIPYWYGVYNGEFMVIVPTAGHLFTLKTTDRGYPVFNYFWVPRWEAEKGSAFLKKFYMAIKTLSSRAYKFINACDYDIEGSVIGYLIIKNFGNTSKALRVKFSSLTRDELRRAFSKLMPLDWEMIEAGLCRHELDWIWGINVSRAVTDVARKLGNNVKALSAGRVQSPTLVEAYRRHIDRETFVPIISFTISVSAIIDGEEYKVEPIFQPIPELSRAKELASKLRSQGYLRVVKAESVSKKLSPPPPFNLPDLQMEASRVLGLSPAETLRIAEDLYLDGLISYPRTNSQKLPPTLDNRRIITSLLKISDYRDISYELLRKPYLRPREGSKEDPAHPAIYPTGNIPKGLKIKHRKLYDLIVRRYLASFYNDAVISIRRYELSFSNLRYSLTGQLIVQREWLKAYPFINISQKSVPRLRVGDLIKVKSVRVIKVYTKPPPKYSRASLLRWMESVGIGTEATRAEIIEVLFKRGYLKSKSGGIEVTELGALVANVLSNLFNELTSVELTREFEKSLESVRLGHTSKANIVRLAREVLEPRLIELREKILRGDIEYIRRAAEIGNPNDKCALCWRLGKYVINGIKLCEVHKRAYDNVIKAYNEWRRRMDINFSEFYRHVIKLSSLGKFCREVMELMTKNGFKPK